MLGRNALSQKQRNQPKVGSFDREMERVDRGGKSRGRFALLVVTVMTGMTSFAAQAQLQRQSPYYFVVQSGSSVMVAAYTALNPDCSVIGSTTLAVTEVPRGGEVLVGQRQLYPSFPMTNARFACDKRRVRHMAVWYRASAGFVGTDAFTAEVHFPGGIARTVRWTVSVRPAA